MREAIKIQVFAELQAGQAYGYFSTGFGADDKKREHLSVNKNFDRFYIFCKRYWL